MSPAGWEAAVVREAWEPLSFRLHIYRRRQRDGVTEVLDSVESDGSMRFREVDEGAQWGPAGILIAVEMIEPIRDAFIKPAAAEKAWEQAGRQRWRALALVVKAKLEAVEAGISEFEQEFLANIVLPDGSTVGEFMGPQIEAAYQTRQMPSALPALTSGR